MSGISEPSRDARFADYVSKAAMKRGAASLAELNRQPITEPNQFRSSLVDRWEAAWLKPLKSLTCNDVLTLLGQGDGLPWLAPAIGEFVAKHPGAEIDFYPGDLTMAALRHFAQIEAADDVAAKQIATTDLTWMPESFDFSQSLQREAEALLASLGSQGPV